MTASGARARGGRGAPLRRAQAARGARRAAAARARRRARRAPCWTRSSSCSARAPTRSAPASALGGRAGRGLRRTGPRGRRVAALRPGARSATPPTVARPARRPAVRHAAVVARVVAAPRRATPRGRSTAASPATPSCSARRCSRGAGDAARGRRLPRSARRVVTTRGVRASCATRRTSTRVTTWRWCGGEDGAVVRSGRPDREVWKALIDLERVAPCLPGRDHHRATTTTAPTTARSRSSSGRRPRPTTARSGSSRPTRRRHTRGAQRARDRQARPGRRQRDDRQHAARARRRARACEADHGLHDHGPARVASAAAG